MFTWIIYKWKINSWVGQLSYKFTQKKNIENDPEEKENDDNQEKDEIIENEKLEIEIKPKVLDMGEEWEIAGRCKPWRVHSDFCRIYCFESVLLFIGIKIPLSWFYYILLSYLGVE